MASESFFVVPTVSNSQETDTALSLNHMSLLTSVETMSCTEDDEFNLDTLRAINDVISAPSSLNNETTGANVEITNSQDMQQGTTTKKGRNSRSKTTKKTSQEATSTQLQPTQSSISVLTPAQEVALTATPYVASHHGNDLYFPDQQLSNVVPTVQAQACPQAFPTPTGMQLAEMFVSKSSEDNGKHFAKPNYLSQCKSRLRKYQSDAIRDFADVFYMPFVNETSFDSLEGAEMQFALRKKVFDCMDTLNKHSQAVWEFEKAIYSCVLPLREKVGGVLSDRHNFNTVTPTRVNNALKRKRQEDLESCRDAALSVEVINQLKPPKSYCLKQWPSRPAGEQFEKLQPLFEAFLLMRQDPDLKLHTYQWVQTLEQFRALLLSLKEKDSVYYEELTRYLVTAGKTRVRWYKDVVNGKLDEVSYVQLCKKQNKQKAPHDILCLM